MTDPRIEAAAVACYVAVQPSHRKPDGWEVVPGAWKKHYRDSARAALAAADKSATITTVEELDALPQGAVIRSVIFGVVRERMDDGWLATDTTDPESSEGIANREHRVLHFGSTE